MNNIPVFSIVAPIYNEIGNIDVLYQRICQVMDSTGDSWELLLVDDGSTDGIELGHQQQHDNDRHNPDRHPNGPGRSWSADMFGEWVAAVAHGRRQIS